MSQICMKNPRQTLEQIAKKSYLAKPLMPVAPRDKHASCNFSNGSVALAKAAFDFICISLFVLCVAAMVADGLLSASLSGAVNNGEKSPKASKMRTQKHFNTKRTLSANP